MPTLTQLREFTPDPVVNEFRNLSRRSLMHSACEIVSKATYSKLDCGEGDIAAHVGYAYDSWLATAKENKVMRPVYNETYYRALYAMLTNELGYAW